MPDRTVTTQTKQDKKGSIENGCAIQQNSAIRKPARQGIENGCVVQ